MTEIIYSRQVLEESPARVAKFLQGIGAVPIIRTILAEAGMTSNDLAEGRTKLLACLAEPTLKAELDTQEARAQRAATTELNQSDESLFARHGATLLRHFPSAYRYVFDNLEPSDTGEGAARGIATFLLRLDALEQSTDGARAATIEQDKQAVALLAQRGLANAERDRLRQLVDVALGPTAPLAPTPSPDEVSAARLARLTELRDWYNEWAAIARAVIKKRSYLIRLGLAARKVGQPGDAGTTGNGNAGGAGPADAG